MPGSYLFSYVALLCLGVLMVAHAWRVAGSYPSSAWEFGPGFIEFTGRDPVTGTSESIAGINPLAFVAMIVLAEIIRLAEWRTQRYVVTTRRVLIFRGLVRRGARVVRRGGGEVVRTIPGGLRIEREGPKGGKVADLSGLGESDEGPLRRGLQTFDATPMEELDDPVRWNTRRLLFLLIGVMVLTVSGGWVVARPGVVNVTATYSPAGGPAQVEVEIDSPRWGSRRTPSFAVEEVRGPDGQDIRVGRERIGGSGGPFREGRSVVIPLTDAPERVIVRGWVGYSLGREKPFEVTVEQGESETFDPGGP